MADDMDQFNALVVQWFADMREDHDGFAAGRTEYVMIECDGAQCPHAGGDALAIERVIVIVRRVTLPERDETEREPS